MIALLSPLMINTKLQAADDPPGARSSEKSEADRTDTPSPLRKLIDESLGWNELFANESSITPMTTRVVMRWTNNTRGSETGATVFYLNDGRPEAVCGIYRWEQNLVHELDSLSRGRLLAKRDGKMMWTPDSAGLTFQAIPDADPPSESPSARLREMKSLARRFSSTMLGWRADKKDREELRLLTQPLYRYETKRADLLDGAVFAFTQGTDPESLLLIEAVPNNGQFQWQFGFVRNTSGELEARDRDKIVWHANAHPANNDPKSTHRVLARPLDASILAELK
jgi:hypothetical protein